MVVDTAISPVAIGASWNSLTSVSVSSTPSRCCMFFCSFSLSLVVSFSFSWPCRQRRPGITTRSASLFYTLTTGGNHAEIIVQTSDRTGPRRCQIVSCDRSSPPVNSHLPGLHTTAAKVTTTTTWAFFCAALASVHFRLRYPTAGSIT